MKLRQAIGLKQIHDNTSKPGVIHRTRSLAMERCGRGIRVNAISPGYTATAMNACPEMVHRTAVFELETPMGGMAGVEEMVGPTISLASRTSSCGTGQDLVVDGGFTRW